MIKEFKHKGLETFFFTGSTKGIVASHAKSLKLILATLHSATSVQDMIRIPKLRCHPLKGSRKGQYSVVVNKNWRVTFEFRGEDVYLTHYEDYHDKKQRR